jgi:hypothetical protein
MGSRKGRRGSVAPGHNKRRLADMSVPPDERVRKTAPARRAGKRKPAQMDHATNPGAVRRAREGEKKMRRTR